MITNKSILLLLAIATLTSLPLHADDLKGEGEFGYTSTSGNTDTTTLNAKLGLGKKLISGITMQKWKY
jgi:putative salt-induced outer membrane protein YdiY